MVGIISKKVTSMTALENPSITGFTAYNNRFKKPSFVSLAVVIVIGKKLKF